MENAMQKVFFFLAFLSISSIGLCQFYVTPTDSIYDTINADSTISIFQIDLVNLEDDTLNITWKLIEQDVTEGWDCNLCDLGECYTGVPNSAEMQGFASGEAGFLKMLVNPLGIVGHGFWHFWVYPTGDEDNFVDLYFSINAEVIENVSGEAETAALPSIYPNPASEKIWVGHTERVQLFTQSGRLIIDLKPQSEFLDISNLPSGIYLISRENAQVSKLLIN